MTLVLKKVSCRAAVMVGGVVVSVAYIITAFTTHIVVYYIVMGVLGGTGNIVNSHNLKGGGEMSSRALTQYWYLYRSFGIVEFIHFYENSIPLKSRDVGNIA